MLNNIKISNFFIHPVISLAGLVAGTPPFSDSPTMQVEEPSHQETTRNFIFKPSLTSASTILNTFRRNKTSLPLIAHHSYVAPIWNPVPAVWLQHPSPPAPPPWRPGGAGRLPLSLAGPHAHCRRLGVPGGLFLLPLFIPGTYHCG